MTTTVTVSCKDGPADTALCVKAIDESGRTRSHLIVPGQSASFFVTPGQGVVLEEIDVAEPDPDAKVLTDGITICDGAA